MPKKKLLVFLSHASEDKTIVRELCKQLSTDGFDPWLDENRILPGQDWNFEIAQALRKSDSILLCFSARSASKEGYIQREYKKAMEYQLEKPEGSIFVIPVRLDHCEIPFFLRELQCVDYPSGYEKLVLSLHLREEKSTSKKRPRGKEEPKPAPEEMEDHSAEVKERPAPSAQRTTNGGINFGGNVGNVGKDIVGRDQNITTNIVYEENAHNVEGMSNPYLGLQAFTYDDRECYAGREKLREEAFQFILAPGEGRNLLFVTGASGSGKSSFVQASLLPRVITHFEQKGFTVPYAVFRPSRHPKARLDDVLLPLGPREIQVVIIDQFEELFTQSILTQRNALVEYLYDLPPFHECHRIFIATLRSDYLGEIHDNMETLWEIAKSGIALRAMKVQELKDAIQRPLQARFPNRNKRFEAQLVEKLAADTFESVTYLPLLQVTLEALWNKGHLKLSSYGSLTDAIKERADTVWAFQDFDHAHPSENRSTEDRNEIIELLLDLVNVSMDDDTRRDVRINRPLHDFTEKQRNLFYELSRARLVSIHIEEGKEIVSLIHETLIRSWDILRDSITAKRIQLQRRVRFETQLRMWISSNRADDYLLSKGQITEARELENSGDIAMMQKEAQDFLSRSIVKIDAIEKREKMLLLTVRKIKELSAPMEDEQRLRKILEDAVHIFDCEAGTLYLLDDQAGDLVFRVTFGPAAEQLQGQRLPAGAGIAGRAAQIREAVIENDAQQSKSHDKTADQLTGFVSRSILAVPMQIGNRTLGVLEIINRRDGLPFFAEDETILTVFAEQAVPTVEKGGFISPVRALGEKTEIMEQLTPEQRVNIAKSDYLAFVTHELKNPMTSIKGYTELLAAGSVGQVNEMQANFLNTIRANVERMSMLVSDLNDNAKIEANRLRLDFKPVDAAEIVDEVIRSSKRQIEDKHQSVELQIPSSLPLIWADRLRVGQILTNLVSNAHKYTPEGGKIIVGAEVTANVWDPDESKRVVHIWVQDNGIGINPEDQANIFQRFFRSDDSKAREAPGTGLGLNITKTLVEMMGGKIWFESELREGSTFHFTIPVAEV
jgi:signal transduction histidine kinase